MSTAPATGWPSGWPSPQKLRRLQEDLNELAKLEPLITDAFMNLLKLPSDPAVLETAKQAVASFANHRLYAALKSGELSKIDDECWYKGWWDDSGKVRKSEVATMMGMLLDSFPSPKIRNPETFVRLLIDDVLSWEPDFEALENACRVLRLTKKSMPSICEVREQYEKSEREWQQRQNGWDAEYHCDAMAARVASIEQSALTNQPSPPLATAAPVAAPLAGVPDGGGDVATTWDNAWASLA
jgi:hypothetical protein